MRVAAVLLVFLVSPVSAGVYSPEEPCPFEVAGGVAKPLPHSTFKSLLNNLRAALNPATPEFVEDGQQQVPTARGKALVRVRDLSAKGAALSPADRLALAAFLLRTGQTGKELAALKAITGPRPADYPLAANYAHVEAQLGNWPLAARNFEDQVLELDPPAAVPGYSPEQLKWVLAVEKTHYRKWLRARQSDEGAKAHANADVYPLFAAKFTGTELPPEEKAKLPPDAIAVVQQLALWTPTDSGLVWLLAELYAANGLLREADDAFDLCTWGAGMTGQKKLMDHRKLVKSAVEKLPPPAPEELIAPPQADGGFFAVFDRDKLFLVGGAFGLIVLALLALQVRALRRRWRGECGPTG